MRLMIDQDGTLHIQYDDGVERYALQHFRTAYKNKRAALVIGQNTNPVRHAENKIVSEAEYPDRMLIQLVREIISRDTNPADRKTALDRLREYMEQTHGGES